MNSIDYDKEEEEKDEVNPFDQIIGDMRSDYKGKSTLDKARKGLKTSSAQKASLNF